MFYVSDIISSAIDDLTRKWHEEGLTESQIREKIDKHFYDTLTNVSNTFQQQIMEVTLQAMNDAVAERNHFKDVFLTQQEEKWGFCFSLSKMYHIAIVEVAGWYAKFIESHIDENEKKRKEYTYASINCLFARACQVYSEILCLVINGFPDGALARWRTMYELCCYAEFIVNNGEDVARAYYYDNGQKNTWAKEASCFKNRKGDKISITDIEKECSFTKGGWGDLKKLACFSVHANGIGTFHRMGMEPGKPIPVGYIDSGIAFPITRATFTLRIIAATFFRIFPSADSIAYSQFINSLADKIFDAYLEADKRQNPEDYSNV